MPKIITFACQKGGVGKSTLSLILGYILADQVKTAVVDMDAQGTISQLKGVIGEGGPDIINGFGSLPDLLALDHKVVIVDTPPYNTNQLHDLFLMSDLVVIPTKAGYPDVMAMSSTIKFYEAAKKAKPTLQAGIVINMVKPRSGLTDSVRQQLEQYGLPVLSEINDRVSIARSIVVGGIKPTEDAKAISEMSDLTNKILSMIL